MSKKTLTPILVLIVTLTLTAPGFGAVEQEAGGHFIVANPIGDFGEATDNLGFGLEGHWGVRPSPQLSLGLGGSIMTYGGEKRRYDLPLVEEFDLTTDNNMAGAFLYAQYRPVEGGLQPYVEGRAGFNYIWTESRLEDEDWWDFEEVARETNFDDFAGFVAGSGGLLVRLVDGAGGGPDIFLDLKVTYQKGFEAEYLTEGAVELVDDRPVYHVTESDMNMMLYQLGVKVGF